MFPRVSQMNPSVANPAAMRAKTQEAIPTAAAVRCSMLFALLAEKLARFLSSREKTALFIAASALRIAEHKLKIADF